MKTSLLSLTASTLLAIGCTTSGQVHGTATVTTPQMVYIDSEVQVIEDYEEPIFYSSNYYWRFEGGVWYRSSNYQRGWVRYEAVPVAIRRIDRPSAYVRYRGNARANVNAERREDKAERKEDKAERKEDQREMKEDRREDKAERKEDKAERKEDKAEHREDKAERKEDKAERKEDKAERKEDRKDDRKDHKDHGKKGR